MLINNNNDMILQVSLIELFFLIRTSMPNPAPEQRPDITEPKPIAPFKYIRVIAIDTSQLGIKPTNAVITG